MSRQRGPKCLVLRSWRRSCRSDRTRWRNIEDRKSTRLNSSHLVISYAVFCLKKKKEQNGDVWKSQDVRSSRPLTLIHLPRLCALIPTNFDSQLYAQYAVEVELVIYVSIHSAT